MSIGTRNPERYDPNYHANIQTSFTSQKEDQLWGPQGFCGSGVKGCLFAGTYGALVIILGDIGSKLIVLGI